jgi:hypothetical protein
MSSSFNHSKKCYSPKKEKKLYVESSDSESEHHKKCKCNCNQIKYDDNNHTKYNCDRTKYDCLDSCLRSEFRKLWSEHAVYTRFYIISVLGNLPDVNVVTARLLQNQIDIGNFTKQFIGEFKGNRLTKLLQQHILAAAAAVSAVKSGNQQAIADAVEQVFQNSRKVSHFISNLNPEFLPFKTILHHFNKHNQFVIDMTIARNNNDFERDIQIYDAYYNQILEFADLVLFGLVDGC